MPRPSTLMADDAALSRPGRIQGGLQSYSPTSSNMAIGAQRDQFGLGMLMVNDRKAQPKDAAGTGQRPKADPFGLISGGEGIFTGTVVCAAAIAYGAGHLHSTAELSIAILGTV